MERGKSGALDTDKERGTALKLSRLNGAKINQSINQSIDPCQEYLGSKFEDGNKYSTPRYLTSLRNAVIPCSQ